MLDKQELHIMLKLFSSRSLTINHYANVSKKSRDILIANSSDEN